MTDLLTLADRVQALTSACRETDALIWWRVERSKAERVYWNAATGLPKPLGDTLPAGLGRLAVEMNAPKFTESLDAAMTLVPEGWFWALCQQPVSAKIWTEGNVAYWVPRGQTDIRPATPILALLVAILRARAALENSHG